MKIGIMTFWWSEDNYGQILQCYALQKYLRDAGHDSYLIRYDPRNDYDKTPIYQRVIKALNPVIFVKFIKDMLKKTASVKEQNEHSRNFSEFRNKYIKYSEKIYYSYNELKNNPPSADAYIVGSDQVWNFYAKNVKICKKLVHAYFLDFGDEKVKRISYAASFGKNELYKSYYKEINPLLKKFSLITVRESTGINICKNCGRDDAVLVPDPTILLEPSVYRSLYINEHCKKLDKKYIFLYVLSNQCDFDYDSILQFAKSKDLQIIYVTGNGVVDKYKKEFVTIPEWLSYIDNAEYIITNSFHGTVFSLLFNKQVGVLKLTGNHQCMNSRFDSLFTLFNIDPRYIQNNIFSILDNKYVKKCNKKIEILNKINRD